MQLADVQEVVGRHPFRPFEFVTTSGERRRINNREHIVLMRDQFAIGYPSYKTDEIPDVIQFFYCDQMADIKETTNRARSKSRKKRGS